MFIQKQFNKYLIKTIFVTVVCRYNMSLSLITVNTHRLIKGIKYSE